MMKAKPYVYHLEHIESGRFYFGYRARNKVHASLDIGIKYFTSCKGITRQNFDEYRVMFWEFDEADCAYREENNLIWAEWNNPLLINKMVQRPDGTKFNTKGRLMSAEAKAKMSSAAKGRPSPKKGIPMSEEQKAKISAAQKGRKKGPLSEEHKANVSSAMKGRKCSEEHKANVSAALKGIKKGPMSEEHKAKISVAKRRMNNAIH